MWLTRHDVAVAADQAALCGLIGALGGAILGDSSTLTVPLLTHRLARREQQRVRGDAEFDRLMGVRQTTRKVLIVLDDAHRTVLRVNLWTGQRSRPRSKPRWQR